jgi:uncharacterized protein
MTRPPSVFIVAAVSTYTTIPSSFDVAGETCAASIHIPVGDPQSRRPGVVLVHGYGCTQNMRLRPYVAGLTAAGLAVLTYDPRNMGQSDGMPRNRVDPDRLVADAQGAVAALGGVGSVSSVGIVGFSFGGGVAIEVAAQDPALFALVHVVGFVAGHPRSEAELAALLPAIEADLAVPICGVPGSAAVLPTADAVAGYRLLDVDGTAVNEVPARSLLATAAFAPGPSLAEVACPALFIVCENDLDVDPAASLAAADSHPRSEVVTYTGGHFDVFRPGPAGRWARQIAAFLLNAISVCQAVR